MPDRSLDSLSSAFYPVACELIARLVARDVICKIVQTRRTIDEHQRNLIAGTSGTIYSLHLPRDLRQPTLVGLVEPFGPEDIDHDMADALDLCPYEIYQLHGPDKLQWNAKDPAWGIIGREAERLNLRWGGRWRKPFDPGHVELVLPGKMALLTEERQRPWPVFA